MHARVANRVERQAFGSQRSPPCLPKRFLCTVLQTEPLTRSRALDQVADRLRDTFGEALQALYVLPDNPYEPAGDDEWIVLAAVLDDAVHDEQETSRQASDVGCAFEREVDWCYVVTVFTMSATEIETGNTEIARIARSGGVRL